MFYRGSNINLKSANPMITFSQQDRLGKKFFKQAPQNLYLREDFYFTFYKKYEI